MRGFVMIAIVGLACSGVVAPVAAQTGPPSSLSGGTSSEAEGAHGESLSTKLNRSDGVISPKSDVDPGIHVQAPDPHPNSTPVVPPAATGGGNAK